MKRVALVIGNQDYVENTLHNPINDALGIKERLESIGFSVLLKKNLTLAGFYQALEELKAMVEPNNTTLFFYFAGHGNTLQQKSSEEYLMMTDKKEKVLVSIYRLYAFLNEAEAKHNIVVIDACRDYQKSYIPANKFANSSYLRNSRNYQGNYRGNFRANITQSEGKTVDEFVIHDDDASDRFPQSTIISYATMHNQMARDWSRYNANHSPYTRQLMKYLVQEEIPIEEVFRRVRTGLIQETNRMQINLEESSLEKNVWLVPKEGKIALSPPI
jgi:uncharacterized caspase-like protein